MGKLGISFPNGKSFKNVYPSDEPKPPFTPPVDNSRRTLSASRILIMFLTTILGILIIAVLIVAFLQNKSRDHRTIVETRVVHREMLQRQLMMGYRRPVVVTRAPITTTTTTTTASTTTTTSPLKITIHIHLKSLNIDPDKKLQETYPELMNHPNYRKIIRMIQQSSSEIRTCYDSSIGDHRVNIFNETVDQILETYFSEIDLMKFPNPAKRIKVFLDNIKSLSKLIADCMQEPIDNRNQFGLTSMSVLSHDEFRHL